MMINLIGTGFPLFVLQIVIYPIVAKMIPAEVYGQMQSTLSVIYLVGGTLFALGLIAFVFLKIYRHKRNVRQAETYSGPPMPKEPAREPAEEPAAEPAEEK